MTVHHCCRVDLTTDEPMRISCVLLDIDSREATEQYSKATYQRAAVMLGSYPRWNTWSRSRKTPNFINFY